MAKKKVKNPEKPKKESWFKNIQYGRSVSVDFFKANAWMIVLFLVMIIALIGLRYKTKTKMAEIQQLEIELRRAESNKLQEKALYMSLIRETEMVKMVKEKNLNLEYQEQPPYKLTKDGTE